MENELNDSLSRKYAIDGETIVKLYSRLVDKSYIAKAVRMFANGELNYDVLTKDDAIDIASIRHVRAINLLDGRRLAQKELDWKIATYEYYKHCHKLMLDNGKNGVEIVYVDDGRLSAFAHYRGSEGGIYSANNAFMTDLNWKPHQYLSRLRKMNKAFYRKVKKAAYAEDKALFDFNHYE